MGAGVRVGATPACGTLSQTSARGTHKDKLKETVGQPFSDNGSSRKDVTRDCESAVTGCLQPGHARALCADGWSESTVQEGRQWPQVPKRHLKHGKGHWDTEFLTLFNLKEFKKYLYGLGTVENIFFLLAVPHGMRDLSSLTRG